MFSLAAPSTWFAKAITLTYVRHVFATGPRGYPNCLRLLHLAWVGLDPRQHARQAGLDLSRP